MWDNMLFLENMLIVIYTELRPRAKCPRIKYLKCIFPQN